VNTIATTPRGNWLTRLVRRWWIDRRLAMLERDIEFFEHEAKLMPKRAKAHSRAAAALRIERVLLEE
jgi:hypothetical protein